MDLEKFWGSQGIYVCEPHMLKLPSGSGYVLISCFVSGFTKPSSDTGPISCKALHFKLSCLDLITKTVGGIEGPFCWGVA